VDGVAYEINAGSVDTVNSVEAPRAITVAERGAISLGSSSIYRFPAHSLTVLRLAAR